MEVIESVPKTQTVNKKKSRKSRKKTVKAESLSVVSDTEANVEVVAAEPAQAPKKTKATKSKKTESVEDDSTAEALETHEVSEDIDESKSVSQDNETNSSVGDESSVDDSSFDSEYEQLLKLLVVVRKTTAQLNKVAKDLKKKHNAIKKLAKSKTRRKKTGEPKKMKSGIFKTYVINSPELAKFLSISVGEEACRVTVLQEISKYVKEHSLQIEGNAQRFKIPDEEEDPLHTLFPEIKDMAYTEIMGSIKKFFPPTQSDLKKAAKQEIVNVEA